LTEDVHIPEKSAANRSDVESKRVRSTRRLFIRINIAPTSGRWPEIFDPASRAIKKPGARPSLPELQNPYDVYDLLAIAFLIAPTIAINMGPRQPSADIADHATSATSCRRLSIPIIWLPTPPPISPTMVLPTGPRLNFFNKAPAMLPPTAPLIRPTIICVNAGDRDTSSLPTELSYGTLAQESIGGESVMSPYSSTGSVNIGRRGKAGLTDK
jgi:hypothetical protein